MAAHGLAVLDFVFEAVLLAQIIELHQPFLLFLLLIAALNLVA